VPGKWQRSRWDRAMGKRRPVDLNGKKHNWKYVFRFYRIDVEISKWSRSKNRTTRNGLDWGINREIMLNPLVHLLSIDD
jgi:hypothetical protein